MNYLHFESESAITKGDTGTPLAVEVGDDESGPWDLTDAVVKFRYFVAGVPVEKTLTADADQTNNRGKASAMWGSSELTDVDAENYPCQVKVTFDDGEISYAPSKSFSSITIQEPL